MPKARITQETLLVAESRQSKPRISQVTVLFGEQSQAKARISQSTLIVARAITTTTTTSTTTTAPPQDLLRNTQTLLEVFHGDSHVNVIDTQTLIEVFHGDSHIEVRGTQTLIEVFEAFTTTTTTTTTTTAPPRTVCWGHDTGVEEEATEDFTGNWTGNAAIQGSGDSEKLQLYSDQNKKSPIWYYGNRTAKVIQNKYGTGDNVSVYYKDGSTVQACSQDDWNLYSTPFLCSNYLQLKVVRGNTTTTTTT
jgi:hypothetical protein